MENTNNEVRGLIIQPSDMKEARDIVQNGLFQLGLYGLSGDTLYPKKDSYSKLENIILYGCQQASNKHSFSDSVKACYGEERVEAAIGKSLGRDGITVTAKTIYSILTSRCFKELGDFI